MADLIRTKEAAKRLGIGQTRFRELVAEGRVAVIETSHSTKGDRFDPDEIDAFIKANRKYRRIAPCQSIKEEPYGGLKSISLGNHAHLDSLLDQLQRKTPSSSSAE